MTIFQLHKMFSNRPSLNLKLFSQCSSMVMALAILSCTPKKKYAEILQFLFCVFFFFFHLQNILLTGTWAKVFTQEYFDYLPSSSSGGSRRRSSYAGKKKSTNRKVCCKYIANQMTCDKMYKKKDAIREKKKNYAASIMDEWPSL